MNILENFPTMDSESLRAFKKTIDLGFRDFSRTYGDGLESFFEPLLFFLVWLEKILVTTPWPIIIICLAILSWFVSKSLLLAVLSAGAFLLIGYFGMWEDTMATLAIISVSTLICILAQ